MQTLLNKDLATVARQINPYIKVIYRKQRAALFTRSFTTWALAFQNIDASSQNKPGRYQRRMYQLRRWTYAGGKQWKGLMTRVRLSVKSVCGVSNEQSNRDYSALVICIIVCLSWAVNHYRVTPLPTKPSATKMPENWSWRRGNYWHADAPAWCCCTGWKITKELANAKAENDALRDDVAVVVVGCTSKQSVSQCVKPPPLRRG